MSETTTNTTNNGNKASQSRGQNAEITTGKSQRRPRALQALPAAVSLANLNQVQYAAQVSKIAVQWGQLKNYELFSLSSDGSEPYMKVSRSKAVKLSDREVVQTDSGNCYRIKLANLPIIINQP